jgi:hypothetical protein
MKKLTIKISHGDHASKILLDLEHLANGRFGILARALERGIQDLQKMSGGLTEPVAVSMKIQKNRSEAG